MGLRELLTRFRSCNAASEPVGATDSTAETVVAVEQLLQSGIAYRASGDYARASQALLEAIALQHDCAESHYQLGMLHLQQADFEDAVDCLELATHFKPEMVMAHLELGTALARLGRREAAKSACQRALKLAPHSAAGWLRSGNILKMVGDPEAAIECYRKALTCDPSMADAYCQLAFVLYKVGRYEESHEMHAAGLELNPDVPELHHNLGLLLLETGYAGEALLSFERALALQPQQLVTRTCIAHALRDLGRLDEALAQYDRVLAETPDFGDALINRCYALLLRGSYSDGWKEYERRFEATATPARGFPFSEWRGEPLLGKRILVYAEQGLGDEIMFASCLHDLLQRCDDVTIECHPRLAGLYRRSFSSARVHGADKRETHDWLQEVPRIHYQVPIGSLPSHFRRTRGAFPSRQAYLIADVERTDAWRRRFAQEARGLRIGIAWRGGSLRTRQATRTIELEECLPLLQQAGAQFVSLQYGDASSEIQRLERIHNVYVRDYGAQLEDLDELAAAITALDVVISVDNTVAHLAGALGHKTWILIPYSPEWRYLVAGEDMPWYPSARLFRQRQPRTWNDVLMAVQRELQNMMSATRV